MLLAAGSASAVPVPPTPLPVAPASSAPVQRGVNVQPAPGSAHASTSGSHVELGKVTPGTSIEDAVSVTNIGPEPLDVDLYVADAIPSYGGGYGFTARGIAGTDVGRWVTLPVTRLTVPARSTSNVPYTVLIPADAPGGEYVGGIVAEPVAPPAAANAGTGVQTVTRFAMGVYLTVPGGAAGATPGKGTPGGTLEITKVELKHQGSQTCPVVDYHNGTQQVLDPVGTVEMRGGFLGGNQRTVSREKAGGVLPGTTAVGVALPCVRTPVGKPTLRVILTAPAQPGVVATPDAVRDLPLRNLPFSVVLAAGMPLLLLLLLGAWLLTRPRRRRHKAAAAAAAAAADATSGPSAPSAAASTPQPRGSDADDAPATTPAGTAS